MVEHTIDYYGLILEVEGSYYAGTSNGYLQPGDEEEFEIDSVRICENDIDVLLTPDHYIEIENMIINQYYK